jgi:hypothetical protein
MARLAIRVLGGALLTLCLCGFSPSDPAWTASDRLDATRGVPRAKSAWLDIGLTSWEAFPEALESRMRAGWEPAVGAGLRLAWRALTWDGAAAHDVEAGAVLRGNRWRSETSWGESRLAPYHQSRVSEWILLALAPSVAIGGSLVMFPGAARGAPEFEIEARSQSGPWLLGLVLRDAAGEATIGLQARPHLLVFMRYADQVPALGIVLQARSLQLRAEAEDHPLLGRTARVGLRWSRGGS